MTLATHIIIAAAVSKPVGIAYPVFVFLASLATHYLSDAIPHWDYRLRSLPEEKDMHNRAFSSARAFLHDLKKIVPDALVGISVAALALWPETNEQYLFWALVVIGSVLPDFLQGVYYATHLKILEPIQRFHDLVHTKIKLGPYPKFGIPFQVVIALLAVYFLW